MRLTEIIRSYTRLAAADIEGQPFVTFGKRNHLHRFFVETCEAAGVKPNIIMTTSDAHLLVRTAEQQQACSFGFPLHIELVESPTHVLVPLDLNTETVCGTYAVKRQGAALSSSARAFWDFLAKVQEGMGKEDGPRPARRARAVARAPVNPSAEVQEPLRGRQRT